MSEAQILLEKIAALRQQLQQVQSAEGGPPVAARSEEAEEASRVWRLERHVTAGAQHNGLLDGALRQLPGAAPSAPEAVPLPRQLTGRARRLLEQGRELLGRLRVLAEYFDHTQPADDEADPLASLYHETAAMAETGLRVVQAFPDAPSAQLRLCDGLGPILGVIAERIATLTAAVAQRRQEAERVQKLADLLSGLYAGQPLTIQPFLSLAEELLAEARAGAPIRFLAAGPEEPARFVACHSLTVAQVVARVQRYDAELRSRSTEAVLAALVHDVGMLGVAPETLAQAEPLSDEQRRVIERHVAVGAELAGRLLPSPDWLVEAVAGHHERLDGTGYPGGLRESQLSALTRLLAVCDVYAALCSPRPHRPALDTRTALADTLVLAEQGLLDRAQAERLLQLSFYPVGSAVELADGALAVVIATPMSRRDWTTPARPVVAVLADADGQLLPAPQTVDLAQCESRSIVRALPPAERRQLLGKRYPELI
jgi:HD-GYP domain-containing protein (c-di-GMP phosphodiesterase class II)